jgi:hypothetical protein
MSKVRLLFPFTHGIDAHALTHALRFAKAAQVTLVVVALIRLPQREGAKGPRLERIQQAKDFLEFMRTKAAIFQVTIELHEVFTEDVTKDIMLSIHQLGCQGLLLVQREREARYALVKEVEQLIRQTLPFSLYILRSTS